MACDVGGAPCAEDGCLTIAICKQVMRRNAKVGDIMSASKFTKNEYAHYKRDHATRIAYKAPEGTPCSICGKTDRRMVFDHCHEKEVFRGYLCDPCNRSMGVLGDNIEGLLRCVNYLQVTEKKVIVQDKAGKLTVIKK